MRRTLTAAVAAVILLMPTAAQAEERPWREVPLPTLWPDFAITHVAGAGPNSAWIAGYEGRKCVTLPLPPWGAEFCSLNAIVRKWNGTRWENKNPPDLLNLRVSDLQASSPTNVWLTGDYEYLARWNGSRWSKIAAPPGCSYLYQIQTLGTDELLATYSATTDTDTNTCLAHWKAGKWQVHMITGQSIGHLGSTGPGEIVIGTTSRDGTNTRGTYRYTGSTWEPLPTPPTHTTLALTGPGARYYSTWDRSDMLKVTAAGTETIPPAPDGARRELLDDLGRLWAHNDDTFYRYDGTAWQAVPPGMALPALYDWTAVPNSQGVLWTIGGTTTDDTRTYHTLTNG